MPRAMPLQEGVLLDRSRWLRKERAMPVIRYDKINKFHTDEDQEPEGCSVRRGWARAALYARRGPQGSGVCRWYRHVCCSQAELRPQDDLQLHGPISGAA